MYILQICSSVYVILLLLVYTNKRQYNNLINQNYKYLLPYTVCLLIFEILSIFGLNNYPNEVLVNSLLYKGYLIWVCIWCVTYVFYVIYVNRSFSIDTNFSRAFIKLKPVTILTTICFILGALILFTPINISSDLTNINGMSLNIFYLTSFSFCLIGLICCIIKKEVNAKERFILIILQLIIAALIALQYFYPNHAFISFGFSVIIVFMYFTIESPDVKFNKQLNFLKDKAETANQAKTDFLASMSHEIRTPMNAIVGITESLLNSNVPIDIKEDLKSVDDASHILLEIINNILDISKIESGKMEIINNNYNIIYSIKELNVIINSRIGNKPIKFNTQFIGNIPKIIYGDETKVIQILLNILNNSVKYTDSGFIDLKVNCKTNLDMAYFTFTISDSGKGIKKEDYDKLFQKFIRLDSVNNRSIEGTGLGLALTKNLIDILGGKISFDSVYGKGTTFTIELSQKIIDSTPSSLEDTSSINTPITNEEINYFDGSSYKLLVVDDNKLNLKVMEKILSPYNFNVSYISNGSDCLKYTLTNNYDIIFLDHMMPEMNGIEVLHKLRERVVLENTPIIVLTANAVAGMKEMYLKEGFTDYISKPIDRVKLHNILIKYLKKN